MAAAKAATAREEWEMASMVMDWWVRRCRGDLEVRIHRPSELSDRRADPLQVPVTMVDIMPKVKETGCGQLPLPQNDITPQESSQLDRLTELQLYLAGREWENPLQVKEQYVLVSEQCTRSMEATKVECLPCRQSKPLEALRDERDAQNQAYRW
eukprot:c29659_g1_i1 orf=139-600(+)